MRICPTLRIIPRKIRTVSRKAPAELRNDDTSKLTTEYTFTFYVRTYPQESHYPRRQSTVIRRTKRLIILRFRQSRMRKDHWHFYQNSKCLYVRIVRNICLGGTATDKTRRSTYCTYTFPSCSTETVKHAPSWFRCRLRSSNLWESVRFKGTYVRPYLARNTAGGWKYNVGSRMPQNLTRT